MYDRAYIFMMIGMLIFIVAFMIVFSHFEAKTFEKLTGREVSTLEAVFVQLRVIEQIKPDLKMTVTGAISPPTYSYSWKKLEDQMYRVKRTDDEVDEVLNKAADGIDSGSRYPGMSFEDGISQFANWLFGHVEEPPFDNE